MAVVWRIELLGSLRLIGDHGTLEHFQTRKTEELLALLALPPITRKTREQLIETLWPEIDPATGRNRLSQALAWLRARLEPEGVLPESVLQADRRTIGLNPQAIESDIAVLEELLSGPVTEETLALYTADLLPELDAEWLAWRREQLRERFTEATRQRVRQLEPAQAEPLLRRALEFEPLSEELHTELIQNLIAQRRYGAAQRHYEALARHWSTTFGLEPPQELRSLLASPRPLPQPLPVAFTRFFGRTDELAQITEAILEKKTRLLTITGLGGTGKTRLALEAAHHLKPALQDQVIVVSLTDRDEGEGLALRITEALGIKPQRGDALQAIVELLRGPSTLLVLDNLEFAGAAALRTLRELLQRLPLLSLIVTARQPLGLEGEWELSLSSLSVESSVELFTDRAQMAAGGFTVTAENHSQVELLCERLEGWPLAIELCATWVQTLSLEQIESYLTRRFDLLVSRRRDIPERHRTLRAAIESSFLQLPDTLRQRFVQLAVFRGGWTLEQAYALAEETESVVGIANDLTALRERSLIIASDGRFSMLETLRTFALEQHPISEEAPLRRRHAHLFGQLASEAIRLSDTGEKMRWLEREQENLRATLEWAHEYQEGEFGLTLAVSLAEYWVARGHVIEGKYQVSQFLAQVTDAPLLQAQGELSLALLTRAQGQYGEAEAAARAALAHTSGIEQPLLEARLYILLATIEFTREAYTEAKHSLEVALERARVSNDTECQARALQNLGNIAMEEYAWEEAQSYFEEAHQMVRSISGSSATAGILNNLGLIARYRGQYALALTLLDESLQLHVKIGEVPGIAIAQLNQATILRLLGRLTEARLLLKEALLHAQESRELRARAWCWKEWGHLFQTEGNASVATLLLSASEAERLRLGINFRPADPAALNDACALLQQELGDSAFQSLWQQGQYLTQAQLDEMLI